jgi:hypothetical protein
VSPYGIGVREFLLSPELAPRIREEFNIDLYTELNFVDPTEWGIRKVIRKTRAHIFSRLAHVFDQRSVWLRWVLTFKQYFAQSNLTPLYDLLMGVRTKKRIPDTSVRFGNRIANSPFKNLVLASVSPFPRYGELSRQISNGEYDMVLVTHPSEGESSVAGLVANRLGIPLTCMSMGVDNLQNGPMLFDPDLFILWGPEQKYYLENYHRAYRPSLERSMLRIAGAVPHDALALADKSIFDNHYPHISPECTVVTFAAYTERAYPDQAETCRIILDTFDRLSIDGHVVVRMRPGLDQAVWEAFQREHIDRVTIQNPAGAFYSKWDNENRVMKSVEESDYALFGATLKRSKLVVAAGFSTVIFDSIAIGTPALASGITPDIESREFFRDQYQACSGVIPALGLLDFITDDQHFVNQVERYLTTDKPPTKDLPNYEAYLTQVTPSNGKAGLNAFNAIIELLSADAADHEAI